MALSETEFEPPLPRHVRFRHIRAAGIADSYTALDRLVRDHGFPAGRLISPNVRAWTVEEIESWLATRPTARKPGPARKRVTPRGDDYGGAS
jgi:predicted DNA-binding transcriptional regulator AlpA